MRVHTILGALTGLAVAASAGTAGTASMTVLEEVPETSGQNDKIVEDLDKAVNEGNQGAAGRVMTFRAATGMTAYNLVDLTQGITNTILRELYSFAITGGLVGDQSSRVVAEKVLRFIEIRLQSIFKALRSSKDNFDIFNYYIHQEIGPILQSSFWKSPEASKMLLEDLSLSIVLDALRYKKILDRARQGGDPSPSPKAGQIATERLSQLCTALDLIGAPVPLTGPFSGGVDYSRPGITREQAVAGTHLSFRVVYAELCAGVILR